MKRGLGGLIRLAFLGATCLAALSAWPALAAAPSPGPDEPPGFETLLNGLSPGTAWKFTGGSPDLLHGVGLQSIVPDYKEPDFAIALGRGNFYEITTDGGVSWRLSKGAPAGLLNNAAIWHGSRGRWIYIAGSLGLWRSTDDGGSWSQIFTDIGGVSIASNTLLFGAKGEVRRAILPDQSFRSYPVPGGWSQPFEWTHRGHETILAMPQTHPSEGYSLYVKQDGAPFVRSAWPTWRGFFNGQSPGGPLANGFFAFPDSPVVLAATIGLDMPGGIWRSSDAGMTWKLVPVPYHREGGPIYDGDPTTDEVPCCDSLQRIDGFRFGDRLVLFADGGVGGSIASYDGGLSWHGIHNSDGGPGNVSFDLIQPIPTATGIDFLAITGPSIWHQILPGLRVTAVLPRASDAALADSAPDLIQVSLIGGVLGVGIMTVGVVWRRRPSNRRHSQV